jgi:diguanylate cyclase (GGDEF)-like protein
MTFDLPTLLTAGSFVAAVSGVFLIFAWLQTEEARGILWWAAADLLLGASVPIMATTPFVAGSAQIIVGITLLNLSPALIWASARAVNRQPVNIVAVGSAGVIWLLAMVTPEFRESANLQIGLNLTLSALYLFAGALEFWRGRSDRLTARWPLIVLLLLHAGSCVFGAADVLFFERGTGTAVAILNSWLAFVHLETLAFVIGTSIFTVAMARERNENMHRLAASTDALTGVATRRSFYERGEALMQTLGDDPRLGIVLFDLDKFKLINDTFGHARGDKVLQHFGAAALSTVRSTDIVGRLGGEEFCVLLPGASVGAAYIAAERIRAAFAKDCDGCTDGKVRATVSAGVAAARPGMTLDSLLQTADLALYRAKLQGRDRVEVETAPEPEPTVTELPQPAETRQVA